MEFEWFMSGVGIDEATMAQLCALLKKAGYRICPNGLPRLPLCEIRMVDRSLRITSQFPDELRRENPITMAQAFTIDGGEFLTFLSACVARVLDRTLRYWSLVLAIRSERTIAFIGSGLSVGAGYKNWSQLLGTLVGEAGVPHLLVDVESGLDKALEIAETCKERLGEKFYEILAREYGERRPGHSVTHVDLLRMPFKSYMTTNFDPCLEVAAEHASEKVDIYIWPEFGEADVGNRRIFYLHAKVPREAQKGHCKVERIRLTASDYVEAYPEAGNGKAYIADLIQLAIKQQLVLVFIGYGLREPSMRAVLKVALSRKKAVAEHWRKYGLSLETDGVHFAFIPEGQIPPDELAALLKDCQVQIIEFPTMGGDFSELDRLLDDLYRRTAKFTTPLILGSGGQPYIDRGLDVA